MGLPYEVVPFTARSPETASPEFSTISPRRKIPAFQHGDVVLLETGAILSYIVDTFPKPGHIHAPLGAAERAKVLEWCFFAMTELDANSLYVIRKHKELKHIFGDAPVAVSAAQNYFLQMLQAMLPRIAAAHPFLLSSKLSIADIMLAGCLDWATKLDIRLPEAAARYFQLMRERNAFVEASKRNDLKSGE
jgi:glutathione S-transferase